MFAEVTYIRTEIMAVSEEDKIGMSKIRVKKQDYSADLAQQMTE